MFDSTEIPFDQIIQAILDENTPFPAKYLYRLSDITSAEVASVKQAWPRISLLRRQALLDDMQEMASADYLLDFSAVARLALPDMDPFVRLLAVRILGEFEPLDLLSTFMKLAEHDPDAEVRAASTLVLGSYVYSGEVGEIPKSKLRQVEECLLRVMHSESSPLVRRRALESLGFSSRDEVPAMIEAAFNQGDRDWLVSSLLAMGRSSNKHWNTQVLSMLDDHRPDVRAEAAAAAGELTIRSATRRLFALLDDSDDDVRAAAIWSLSEIGGEGVRRRLENLLEHTEDEDEVDLIESALDNLSFTEDFEKFAILELSEDDDDYDDDSLEFDDYLEDEVEGDEDDEVDEDDYEEDLD